MSSRDTTALALQAISNVSIVTHDDQDVAARCDTSEQHLSATATVESQRDGITASIESEQRDSPVYIDKLPSEILSWIFHLVNVDEWVTRTALRMGTVCRRWRYIVTGTGSFWTDIRASQIDLARLSVARSQQASVDFFLPENFAPTLTYLGPRLCPVFPAQGVNLLISSIGRIGTLTLKMHCETYSTLLLRLAPFTAPSLKALHLKLSEEGSMEHHTSQVPPHDANTLASLRLNAPSLEHLSILIRKLRRKVTFHPGIVSLSLELSSGGSHDPYFLLGTLRAHKKLVDLRLTLNGPLYEREHGTNSRLLRLKSLYLKVSEVEDAGHLLRRMKIPEIAQVELDLRTSRPFASASIGSRLKHAISFLPSEFLLMPVYADIEKSKSAMFIKMKEHPWSPPTVSIYLRWSHYPIEMIVWGVMHSLIRVFPCLSVAYYDNESWVLRYEGRTRRFWWSMLR